MNPHNPFLLRVWSGSPSPLPHHPDAITQDFFHILQPHLPFVASPKAGCLRRDSFLPLLLDIQTGGQGAWTEIAWGREPRGLSDKQPERDGSAPAITVLSGYIHATQIIYAGFG